MNERWHLVTADETIEKLETQRAGLGADEAASRQERYGPNELQRKKKTPAIVVFLRQFLSPLIYVLLIAIIISIVVEHYIDAGVIAGVLLINAIIGYLQETRAERAMEALMQMAGPKVKVRRDGKTAAMPARELVPGDIIVLESGDKVPADARVIEATNLKVGEAALTGESVATDKQVRALREDAPLAERRNMVYMGTIVNYGRATAVVVATGAATEMGRIAEALEEVKREQTPLQRSISTIGRYLVVFFVVVAALLVVIGVVRGLDWLEIFLVAVAAAVSAIPEGLPAIVTVVLALGMRTMASRNAVVRRLVAVETLGAATVICTDKTGTLTLNEMTVRRISLDGRSYEVTGEGYDPRGEFRRDGTASDPSDDDTLTLLLRIGALCNDALLTECDTDCTILGDPTEGALVVAAAKAGMRKEDLEKSYQRQDEIPFQSEKQYMATFHHVGGKRVAYVKGSPEKVRAMSGKALRNGRPEALDDDAARAIEEASASMAREALRVIALAYAEFPETTEVEDTDLRGNLVFVGLAGMYDPPRDEAIRAVDQCKRAGIRVVMVTGDNQVTADAIGRQIGLAEGKTVTGSDLEQMDDNQLAREVEEISVYARVEPLHKLRIVNALKSRGETVAMTGDGVNDAPALRSASIGVAMGVKGTDVAKEAADMVLTDDNFASIVAAVEEGRSIFNRLRNVLFFVLATNVGELLAFLLSLIFVGRAPLLAVQIIWVNLVTDTAMGLPLGLEPKSGDELVQPPRHPKVGLLYEGLLLRVAFLASIMGVGVFGLFYWFNDRVSLEEARTMAFCTLVAFEWFRALNARSDERTLWSLGLFTNKYLIGAIAIALGLQMTVVYAPFMQVAFGTVGLAPSQWGIVFAAGAALFLIEEGRKVLAPTIFSRGKWVPGERSDGRTR